MAEVMNELDLKGIHLPEAVSWWPPAIGWWVLLLLFVLSAVALFYVFKRLQQVSVRSKAVEAFLQIKADYQKEQDKVLLSQQISQLLRQILLSSFAREEVASVTGEAWFKALQVCHPKGQLELKWIEVLSVSAYQKQADYDAKGLLNHCEQWIVSLPKRYLL